MKRRTGAQLRDLLKSMKQLDGASKAAADAGTKLRATRAQIWRSSAKMRRLLPKIGPAIDSCSNHLAQRPR